MEIGYLKVLNELYDCQGETKSSPLSYKYITAELT